jgi:hypothetical protein
MSAINMDAPIAQLIERLRKASRPLTHLQLVKTGYQFLVLEHLLRTGDIRRVKGPRSSKTYYDLPDACRPSEEGDRS